MYKVLGSDQQVYGPVTAAQLRQWMAEGRVHPSTLVLLEGATEWKPVASFFELATPPTPPTVSMPQLPARSDKNNMAVWALICGILSNLCCCASTLFGILGLIFSIIILSRRQDYPGENHRQMALAGLILSIIGLLWHSLLPLFFFMPGTRLMHSFHTWRM